MNLAGDGWLQERMSPLKVHSGVEPADPPANTVTTVQARPTPSVTGNGSGLAGRRPTQRDYPALKRRKKRR